MVAMLSLFVLVLCGSVSIGHSFLLGGPTTSVDPGQPLFLSPYIAGGHIQQAQNLSRVGSLQGSSILSYSGYITVNADFNSNLFFWFIPAQHADPHTAPLLLWLEGGPWGSSLFALFVQNGPFVVDKDLKLSLRKTDWSLKYSMLFIDNPVGTGFSFTDSDKGYATTEDDVARDLYSFLLQFYTMFPKFQKNDLYITGESYAGKYISAISYKIHTENPKDKININLKGLFIGAGFIDPISMIPAYADYLFNVGLFDENEKQYFQGLIGKVTELVKAKDFKNAMDIFSAAMLEKGFFYNATGYIDYENILEVQEPAEMTYFVSYVDHPEVRRAIHVGNLSYTAFSIQVGEFLYTDILDSVRPWFVTLLNSGKYKVLLFNGQLDIIVCLPATEAMLDSMTEWKDQAAYKQATKHIWRVSPTDKDVAGYVRAVGNFTQVTVREAGHIVTFDQPDWTYDMLQRYIEDRPFY
ncbi:probable serine carboxypeptidase CPVL [Haliotis rubra]|uniref:probable serine carboxypeptidase CPVL n=1 Tax=Haliotis rubra TaxID=36100 RepID=UPI001EE52F62|nr:probable serine carboxypeptidase CPVL [Haliotis rubra]XP_046573547.1 probable serine carboxypeptidase CPVL [Haliotis rubra]